MEQTLNTSSEYLTSLFDGKKRAEVNAILGQESQIPSDNGYKGSYYKIVYDNKEAIIFTDKRDAIIHVISDWYDYIYYKCGNNTIWDGEPWDYPIIVRNNGKYNLIDNMGHLLLSEWVDDCGKQWLYDSNTHSNYRLGMLNGDPIMIFRNGGYSPYKSLQDTIKEMQQAKSLRYDQLQSQWIDRGGKCAYIRGLEMKGAKRKIIDKGQATELLKTHKHFDGMFNDIEWVYINNDVVLLFRDYANSDFD